MSKNNINKYIISGKQDVYVPAHLHFGKYLLDGLRYLGDAVAIENMETGAKLTYKELKEYSVKLAMVLTELGVRKGDVIALGFEKHVKFIPTALAVILIGGTLTPLEYSTGQFHLQHQLKISKPKYIICTELFWKRNHHTLEKSETIKTIFTLENVLDSIVALQPLISNMNDVNVNMFQVAEVQGQVDVAIIMYSSGTSGMPKGVSLSHLNCILSALTLDPLYDEDSLKNVFSFGEWYHSFDYFITCKMLLLGKRTVYADGLDIETIVMALGNGQANLAFLVPAVVQLLSKIDFKESAKLDCLKLIFCGGNPLHEKAIEKLKERFPSLKSLVQGYGMTETWQLTAEIWSPDGPRMGSVGHAAPCISLKVEDPETREVLGPNKPGEICVKGYILMKGYINIDPSDYLDKEGWFRTGDLGYYDDDGYFFISGRLKETIKYFDYQISPSELEMILLLHPGVREAGVVGKPVPVYGEEPTAFVVLQPGASVTEQELVDFVAAEVQPYMQLSGGVKFVSELPRNPRGKLLRRRLQEMLNETV